MAKKPAQKKKTELAKKQEAKLALPTEVAHKLMIGGDLSGLSEEQQIQYYQFMCQQSGLDVSSRPFEFIVFQGKTVLYARKGCAEQLRRIHKISIIDLSVDLVNGNYVATCTARDGNGRCEVDVGTVPEGNNADLAMMKAVTKAKRRVTLGLCGLGSVIEEAHPSDIPQEPVEPKSKLLLEDAKTAKNQFAEACKMRTDFELLPEQLVQLLIQARKASGKATITAAAEWVRNKKPIIAIEADGQAKFKDEPNDAE